MVVAIGNGGDQTMVGSKRARRLLAAALLAAFALLCVSAPVRAATTIGFVATGSAEGTPGSPLAFATGPAYAVPAGGGVITSWSVNAGQATVPNGKPVALRIFQVGTDGSGSIAAKVLAGSRLMNATTGLTTFRTRIPVNGGELLGLYSPVAVATYPAGAESVACSAAGEGSVGSTYLQGQTATCGAGAGVNVSAVVEPDADDDEFGDETQDRCPGLPGPAAGCPGRYRGRADGQLFKLGVGTYGGDKASGSSVERVINKVEFDVVMRCGDGFKERLTVYVGISKSFPIRVKAKDGSFSFRRLFGANKARTGGRLEMSGTIKGARANGSVTVLLKYRHHGTCTTKNAWRARAA